METNMTDIIHTVEGGVLVEYIDKYEQAKQDTANVVPSETKYERIDFLSNGWLKCIDEVGSDEPGIDPIVDYYPPHIICGVHSVEHVDGYSRV